jgi:hypothetical protein
VATKIPNPHALVAAPPAPPLESSKEGFLKVRLSYLTSHPKHIRNIVLRNGYGIKPPYSEDVCILFPAAKTFNDFETYLGTFESLKLSGVLHANDSLIGITILVEDDLTLAYIIP